MVDSPEEVELICRIEEIVHYLWDPDGVGRVPRSRDHYRRFVPGIFEVVKSGDTDRVATHLRQILFELAVPIDEAAVRDVTAVMLDWNAYVARERERRPSIVPPRRR